MKAELVRTFRRIQQIFAIGRTTTAPDETGVVAMVQVQLNDLAQADRRRIIQQFGFAGGLPVGTDVIEIRIHGDPSNAVIIATNNQTYRPKNMQPGEVMVYDAFGKSVYLTKSDGIVVDANGGNVTIKNAPQVNVPDGDVIAGTISLKNHVHSGVTPGGSDTGAPVP